MRPKSHTAAVVLVAVLLVGGCMHPSGQVLNVRNDTGEQLRLSIETGAGTIPRGKVGPYSEVDSGVPGAPECAGSPWVARDVKGEETDRLEPPICPGDTWVIKDRR